MHIDHCRSGLATGVLLVALSSLPAAAGAQAARPAASNGPARTWLLTASGAAHWIGWEQGASLGGSLTFGRYVPKRLGFEVGLSYAGPAGFYNFTGAVLDVGATYTIPARSMSVALSAGASAIVGGDSDGTGGAAGGGYGSVAALWRITPVLVLRTGVVGRLTTAGPVYFVPTGQIGLGVAF